MPTSTIGMGELLLLRACAEKPVWLWEFTKCGYTVKRRGKPFDLLCIRDSETLFVEVKGTQSNGEAVFLTRNEVQWARGRQLPSQDLGDRP